MKTRIFYLDMLRLWAILCVIGLHCVSPISVRMDLYSTKSWYISLPFNSLFRTGVPLFFMLSGYLMLTNKQTRDVLNFYKKRLPRILIPLLFWNVWYAVSDWIRIGEGISVSNFLEQLLNNGTSYHLWFVYTQAGIYLLAPFLKQIVDKSTPSELLIFWVIILFPPTIRPFFNNVTSASIFLFQPLVEGYIGYFLMGYIIGTKTYSPMARLAIYAGGLFGLLIGIIGNGLASTPIVINLPFNGGYCINHYLCSAAIFVGVKTICERFSMPFFLHIATKLSPMIFGVYFIHVEILKVFQQIASQITSAPLYIYIGFEYIFVTMCSFSIVWILSKIHLLRKLLL